MPETARLRDRFFKHRNDEAALNNLKTAFINFGYSLEESDKAVDKLRRRPLIRRYILAEIEEEIIAAGEVNAQGQIDWESIGDFLVKIAPIIMKLIEMFM